MKEKKEKTVNINGCYCESCVKATRNHVSKITGKGLKKS